MQGRHTQQRLPAGWRTAVHYRSGNQRRGRWCKSLGVRAFADLRQRAQGGDPALLAAEAKHEARARGLSNVRAHLAHGGGGPAAARQYLCRCGIGVGGRQFAEFDAKQTQYLATRGLGGYCCLDSHRRGRCLFARRIRQEARKIAHIAFDIALLAQVRQQRIERPRQARQLVAALQAYVRLVIAGGGLLGGQRHRPHRPQNALGEQVGQQQGEQYRSQATDHHPVENIAITRDDLVGRGQREHGTESTLALAGGRGELRAPVLSTEAQRHFRHRMSGGNGRDHVRRLRRHRLAQGFAAGVVERIGDQLQLLAGRQPEGDLRAADFCDLTTKFVVDALRQQQESDQILILCQWHDRGLVQLVAPPPIAAERRRLGDRGTHQRIVGQGFLKGFGLIAAPEYATLGIEHDGEIEAVFFLAFLEQIGNGFGVRVTAFTQARQIAAGTTGLGDVSGGARIGRDQLHLELQFLQTALLEFLLHRAAGRQRIMHRALGDAVALDIRDHDRCANRQRNQKRRTEKEFYRQRHTETATRILVSIRHRDSCHRACRTCSYAAAHDAGSTPAAPRAVRSWCRA